MPEGKYSTAQTRLFIWDPKTTEAPSTVLGVGVGVGVYKHYIIYVWQEWKGPSSSDDEGAERQDIENVHMRPRSSTCACVQ